MRRNKNITELILFFITYWKNVKVKKKKSKSNVTYSCSSLYGPIMFTPYAGMQLWRNGKNKMFSLPLTKSLKNNSLTRYYNITCGDHMQVRFRYYN